APRSVAQGTIPLPLVGRGWGGGRQVMRRHQRLRVASRPPLPTLPTKLALGRAQARPGWGREESRAGLARSAFRRVVVLGGCGFLTGKNFLGDEAGVLPDRRFDFSRNIGIGLEESFGVLAALADALAVVGEPGAGFLHD